MFNWYKEFLEIRYSQEERLARLSKESVVCNSCETFRQQLEIANFEKKQLLDRLLEKPTTEVTTKEFTPIIPPRRIPWEVKKQMLEAEDREKARILREVPKPIPTEDLEKELEIASAKREAEG